MSADPVADFVESAPWPRPVPLRGSVVVPPFPVAALPAVLAALVEEVAEQTQTPEDLAGNLALSVLSAAAAKRARVVPRLGWVEPLSLYSVTALPPASAKSAVFSIVTAPLFEYQAELGERARLEVRAAAAERATIEAALKLATSKAAKAPSDPTLREEVRARAAELAALPERYLPRLVGDDITPESIAEALFENGERFAILSPEGDLFEMMRGRYSARPNLGVYLKAHAGDQAAVDRKGRPRLLLSAPSLTIGVCAQPDVIRAMGDTPEMSERGLLARFLFSMPASLIGSREMEARPASPETLAAWRFVVRDLLALEPPERTLYLSPSALAELNLFRQWIEERIGPRGEFAALAGWCGKLAGQVVRIAGLLHLASSPHDDCLEHGTVLAALELGRYYLAHADAAFAEMGVSEETSKAEVALGLIYRLRARGELPGRPVSERELFMWVRSRRKLFPDMEAFRPVLALLEAHRYLRPASKSREPGPGRPGGPLWELNPDVYRGGS